MQPGRNRHNSYLKDTSPSTTTVVVSNLEAIPMSVWSSSTTTTTTTTATSSPVTENGNVKINNENNNNNRGKKMQECAWITYIFIDFFF